MADVDQGIEVMGRVGEIMPADATGTVAEIYEDVRGTLRVPFVNFVFRATANFPEVLEGLWSQVRGVAGSTAFERAAGGLRDRAAGDGLEPLPPIQTDEIVDADGLRRAKAFTETIHYVLPKLLLVATGFALLLDDEVAAGAPPELGPDLPRGPVDGSQELAMIGQDEADERVRALYDDIQDRHDHPGVASYYRALAQWPDLLEALWGALRPTVGTRPYQDRSSTLSAAAAEEARGLLAGCRTASDLGLPEEDSRDVRDLVEVFRARLVPDLLVDVTLLRPALGTHGPNRLAV